MKFLRAFLCTVALTLSLTTAAKADPFTPITFDVQIKSTDAKQLGRPARNNVPQDWAGTEQYPGVLGPTNSYYYEKFLFASSVFTGAPYLEVDAYDQANSTSYFVSAYQNTYDPTNPSATWLGDIGQSGNYQTNDGRSFQFILPTNANLILVVNATGASTVPTYAYSLAISAFSDANYSDPIAAAAATPEPSSLILAGSGLLGMAGAFVRRRFAV